MTSTIRAASRSDRRSRHERQKLAWAEAFSRRARMTRWLELAVAPGSGARVRQPWTFRPPHPVLGIAALCTGTACSHTRPPQRASHRQRKYWRWILHP